MNNTGPLFDAVLNGDAGAARTATEQALAAGMDPMKIVQEGMMPAMAEVGRRFESGEFFVPELMLAARAMKAGLELVRPLLAGRANEFVGRVAIGTVKGDLHDIGKNLVGAMLEGGGFEVIDLGVNVPPEKFVAAVRDSNANVIAMSALLTTTMPSMRATIEELTRSGVRDRVKVLVGGAPISQKYADDIGADGYTETAAGAVALARRALAA